MTNLLRGREIGDTCERLGMQITLGNLIRCPADEKANGLAQKWRPVLYYFALNFSLNFSLLYCFSFSYCWSV